MRRKALLTVLDHRTDTVLNVLKLYFVSTGGIIACCDMASIITVSALAPANQV